MGWSSTIGYFTCTGIWLAGLAGDTSPGVARANTIYPLLAMGIGVVGGLLAGEHLGTEGWIGVVLGIDEDVEGEAHPEAGHQ